MLKKHRVLELAVVLAVLFRVTLPASAEDIVKLSGDRNYGGWEAVFGVGEFTTADLIAAGGVDNDVDSVRVAPGYKVELYEEDNFGGTPEIHTADNPDTDWHNKVSSLKVMAVSAADVQAAKLMRSRGRLVFSGLGISGGNIKSSGDTSTWTSGEISTAGASESVLSADIECKEIGNFERSDVLTISYRIDNGAWMPLFELLDDFHRTTFTTSLTSSGQSMQLKIEAKTSASNETYLVHKLMVEASVSRDPPKSPPNNSIDPTGGMQTSKGTLIIDGGSLERVPSHPTIKAIIKHMGGLNQPLVVSPTASKEVTDDEWKEYYDAWDKTIGFKTVSKMHSHDHDPEEANTDAFVRDLRQARGLFMRGGRQWRLVDAYGNADQQTRTLREMWKLLERGGVIAGTSAGATIQGDFLPRGDTGGSGTMISDDANHQRGFCFLPNVAFDVHVGARGRVTDLFEVLKYANERGKDLLGIGIDEDAAIVVQGKVFQVIGSGKVFVHTWNRVKKSDSNEGGCILILRAGDKYNLCTRQKL